MKTGLKPSRTIKRVVFYSMRVCCLGSSPLAHVWAQETDLSVEQIPADLLEGAGAVIRYSNTRVEVKSPRNMVRSVRKAETVLNSRGEDEGIAYVDRTSVVSGKRVSVRVDLVGRRIITKKKKHK